MASFKAKPPPRPLVIWALLLAFDAILPLGIALGQNAPGSPIIVDLPVAGGTERVLFRGTQRAPALLVLLPGGDGIVGLDPGGGIHQLGSNFLMRTFGQWIAQGFDLVMPDAPNGTSLFGRRHLPASGRDQQSRRFRPIARRSASLANCHQPRLDSGGQWWRRILARKYPVSFLPRW